MIKTCELQTCDGLNTVELKDILFSQDSKIKKVSGETLLELPLDLDSISKRLDLIEQTLTNTTDENVYKQIEIELNSIRDWANQVESDFQKINESFLNIKDKINNLNESTLSTDSFKDFKKDFDNWVSKVNGEINKNQSDISTLNERVAKNGIKINTNTQNISNLSNKLKDLQDAYNNIPNEIIEKINSSQVRSDVDTLKAYINNKKEMNTGGLTWKNKNGVTSLIFKSEVNYNSDYGYIKYQDDNNDYAFWGDSNENSAMIVGVENDPQNAVSDVVVLKSPAAVIVDSADLIYKNGNNHFSVISKLGLGMPDFNSGWVSVTRDKGLTINNPLGQDAFFIGYIKFSNGDIMQFGVYSGYEDDDNADINDTGVYLVIQPSKLIIAVRKKANNGTPSAVGLTDGITYETPLQDTFDAKILGWKLPKGVVI